MQLDIEMPPSPVVVAVPGRAGIPFPVADADAQLPVGHASDFLAALACPLSAVRVVSAQPPPSYTIAASDGVTGSAPVTMAAATPAAAPAPASAPVYAPAAV